jgi:hypothetical protein
LNHYDVAIVGGGIVGIWTGAVLQSAGYRCVIFERSLIGSGQTLASQGIIHGGTKYALTGKLTGSSEAVRAMPDRWKQHLDGLCSPDLSGTSINTPFQWMWDAGGVSSKVSSFFASKLMSSRVQHVAADRLPAILKGRRVYQLQEPVLDVKSVLAALSHDLPVFQAEVTDVDHSASGHLALSLSSECAQAEVTADRVVYAAGEGNESIQPLPMQRRPLHMVMVKGELPPLWGHVIEANANPRLTITSHVDNSDGQAVWYIGGQLAETGSQMPVEELFDLAVSEMQAVFPAIDWSSKQWASLLINRAEGVQADGSRPTSPVISQQQGEITVWPTKLVFAPMVADEILQNLRADGVQPSLSRGDDENHEPLEFSAAGLGEYPWDKANWVSL